MLTVYAVAVAALASLLAVVTLAVAALDALLARLTRRDAREHAQRTLWATRPSVMLDAARASERASRLV